MMNPSHHARWKLILFITCSILVNEGGDRPLSVRGFEPSGPPSEASSKRADLDKKAQRKLNRRCLRQLMTLLRDHYSYYELREIDWPAVEKKHRKKIRAARSTNTWVKRVAKMLAKAEDMHLSLEYQGRRVSTFDRRIERNFDLAGIKMAMPGFRQRNRCVFTDRTDDNIGYLLIGTLMRERAPQLEEVQAILREFKDCKALILDLRGNGGGDENLAKPIAAWFVEGERVYAKNSNRDPSAKDGFTRVYSRKITGNAPPDRFDGPVAVLTGPFIMSSAEAFLLMMRQGKQVTLIGDRSFGSSGNPQPHTLENGVTLYLPSWKAMRPDGTCFEGEGIQPDVIVKAKPKTFTKSDPIIERALNLLRKKTN